MNSSKKQINAEVNGIPTSIKEKPKETSKKKKISKSIELKRISKIKNGFYFDKINPKSNKTESSSNYTEKNLNPVKAEPKSFPKKHRNNFHRIQFNNKKSDVGKKRTAKIQSNVRNIQEENKNSINLLNFSVESSQVEIKNITTIKKENTENNIKIERADDIVDINIFKKENEKILNDINDILSQKNPDFNKLLDNLKKLLEYYPAINEFNQVKDPLFSSDDFDIFNDYIDSKILFSINLSNIISVMNLLWEASNKSPKIFIKYINKLGFYFSYVTDKESSANDIVILASIPENFYNYLSTYGGEMFNDITIREKAFTFVHSLTKINYDRGYYFEDMNSINLLNYIGESNYTLLPRLIYYVKENKAKELNKLNIISIPEKFNFHDPSKDLKDYKGYNEIDLAVYIKKDVYIQTNENFRLLPKTEYLKFESAKKENSDKSKRILIPIKLKGEHYYLFEMKISPKSIMDNIDKIREKYNRYIDALKNVDIIQKIKFDVKNYDFVFVCNNSYNDAALATSKKGIKEDIIYSNPQVGLSILLKYDKKFKYLNEKLDSTKKDKEEFNIKLNKLKEENNKIKEEFKKEFNKQNGEINQLKNWIQKMEYDRDISQYNISKNYLTHISNPMKISFLIKTKSINAREETIKRYEKLYNCFDEVSMFFKPIKERQNDLCIRIIKYIGKDIIEKKEKDEWKAIKTEILKKYGNSVYYKGLVLFLFGENHEKKEDFSILSGNSSEIRKYVKNFIIFLSIFMDNSLNEDIEEKFQSVIVYIAYAIIGIEPISELFEKACNVIDKIKNENEKKKIIKLLMQDIITSFNSENTKRILDDYLVKK